MEDASNFAGQLFACEWLANDFHACAKRADGHYRISRVSVVNSTPKIGSSPARFSR